MVADERARDGDAGGDLPDQCGFRKAGEQDAQLWERSEEPKNFGDLGNLLILQRREGIGSQLRDNVRGAC